MILAMKVISLSHDCEKAQKFPTFFEYVGYACCPANCLFGPWIPFSEYCAIIEKPHRRVSKFILIILDYDFSYMLAFSFRTNIGLLE